ncbi:unnamed protein product [Allacma fusca]|uniref:Uncharacterized protein n=1 Tax=Allacma fusca TaxID=39272 RepID=A0A8J2K8K8_9HEXA|nr:unnamed protein product [Allacma fusca]
MDNTPGGQGSKSNQHVVDTSNKKKPRARVRFSSASTQEIPYWHPDHQEVTHTEINPSTRDGSNSLSKASVKTQDEDGHRNNSISPVIESSPSSPQIHPHNPTVTAEDSNPQPEVPTTASPGVAQMPTPTTNFNPSPRKGILKNSIALSPISQPLTQVDTTEEPIVNRFLRHIDSTIVAKKRKDKSNNHNNKPRDD